MARDFEDLWDYDDPDETQARFRAKLDASGNRDAVYCAKAAPRFARAHARRSQDTWLAANQPDRLARLSEPGGTDH